MPTSAAATYVGDFPKYTDQSYEEWKVERLIQRQGVRCLRATETELYLQWLDRPSGRLKIIGVQQFIGGVSIATLPSAILADHNSLQGSKSVIEILIGDGPAVWCLHEAILAAGSTFFKAALNSPFKEGIERKVTLADEDNLVFQLFVLYLHTRTFHTNEIGLLLQAYVLGDKLGAPNFKALALDKIFDLQRQCCRFTAEQVLWVVENTLPRCGLQRLTTDAIVAHGAWRQILKYGKEDWERLAPIMPELMEGIIASTGGHDEKGNGTIKCRMAYQD